MIRNDDDENDQLVAIAYCRRCFGDGGGVNVGGGGGGEISSFSTITTQTPFTKIVNIRLWLPADHDDV